MQADARPAIHDGFRAVMQVSISSKTIPQDTTGREQKPSPPGKSLCTKTLPSGQNRESKAPLPGHKVRIFH